MKHPDDLDIASSSCSAANPAKRIAAESEEIPVRAEFSPEGGNGAVTGISELVRVARLELTTP